MFVVCEHLIKQCGKTAHKQTHQKTQPSNQKKKKKQHKKQNQNKKQNKKNNQTFSFPFLGDLGISSPLPRSLEGEEGGLRAESSFKASSPFLKERDRRIDFFFLKSKKRSVFFF